MAEYFPIAGILVLILSISARIIELQHKGIRVINRKNKTTGRIPVLPVVFLFVLFLWIMELLRPVISFQFSLLPDFMTRLFIISEFLRITGVILIVLAVIFHIMSLIHFSYSLRFGLDHLNSGKLITSGVFSITRNPFFLSLILFFLGIASIYPNVFFLVFTMSAVVGIHRYILREEEFLISVYGDAYRKYMTKTARYL